VQLSFKSHCVVTWYLVQVQHTKQNKKTKFPSLAVQSENGRQIYLQKDLKRVKHEIIIRNNSMVRKKFWNDIQ